MQTAPVRGWTHFAALPFETLFGFLAAVGGVLGLIHFGGTASDAVSLLLPGWLNTTVQALYLTSGVAILAGLYKPRRDVEAFGLVTLMASIGIRFVATFAVLGWSGTVVSSAVYSGLIVAACVARLRTIFRREVVVVAKP